MQNFKYISFIFFLFILTATRSYGQFQGPVFQFDSSVKVYDMQGNDQYLAWSGGFDNSQFSLADLNHDGLPDLVVFDPWHSLKTFINVGTAGNPRYEYYPKYTLNFPPVSEYCILLDYNCDGIPDLFTQQAALGYVVYKGYYNSANELCFTYYEVLYYNNDLNSSGWANAYNNPGDIPAIVDVDGDGDLDFLSYEVSGGHIYWYRNMQVEDGLPCDSIRIKLWDKCWGKVYQGFWRTHYMNINCETDNASLMHRPGGQKVTHSGNAPTLFDWDGDGDYDYLDGSVSFNEMTFLKNGRIPLQPSGADSMIYQDTMWQSNGRVIEMPVFVDAFNIDIDQDGKKDLLISNIWQTTKENYHCIWYYKNYTTPNNPDWRFQSDSFLIDKTIDLGSAAYPQLFDYNKDGKLDLFVGSDGYFQANGSLKSMVSYYENTSTPGHPSFTLRTKDFNGLSNFGFAGIAPTFGDLDNDGKADMLIGHSNGTISFLRNVATSNTVQPQFQMAQPSIVDINSVPISVSANAAPFIYDMDKDGKPDIIIGEYNGYLKYYRNVGVNAGDFKFELVNATLGHAKVDTYYYLNNYSTPYIGKMDSTGKDYILCGSGSGFMYRFDGFQHADTGANVYFPMIDSQYSNIDSFFNLYRYNYDPNAPRILFQTFRSAPTVGDIDGDGKYEMLVGTYAGGINFYKETHIRNLDLQPVSFTEAKVNIYPNPAKDVINISWNEAFTSNALVLTVYNMQGQLVKTSTISNNQNTAKLNVGDLADGMYICTLQAGNAKAFGRFTLIR
jgi:hypothetical protein